VASPISQASRRNGALLLADISGYTTFLSGVTESHIDLIEADETPAAFGVLSQLLHTMVTAIAPTFRLAKFEGDAIFAVTENSTVQGDQVVDIIHRCYAAFRGELATVGDTWVCSCAACAKLADLDLKFVVHHGSYVAQPIAGREEFLGSDVNIVHRLLKNHARELVGSVPYAVVTDAAVRALGISTDQMVQGEETYESMPPVPVHVLALA
jgi:hypothetical protein